MNLAKQSHAFDDARRAYENDCRAMPVYFDSRPYNIPRTPWDRLPDYIKDNWRRYPTPRDWSRLQAQGANFYWGA